MANLDFYINDQAFQELGVKPVIDENLYSELIDQYAPAASSLDIHVVPSVLWDGRNLSQRLKDIREGRAIWPIGGYSSANQSILLPAYPNQERTNKLLRHETKHFIDDINGDSHESGDLMSRQLRGAVMLAGAGVVLGLTGSKKTLVLASGLSTLASMPAVYWNVPHEVAARQFAENPAIKDKYGKIISYKHL